MLVHIEKGRRTGETLVTHSRCLCPSQFNSNQLRFHFFNIYENCGNVEKNYVAIKIRKNHSGDLRKFRHFGDF